MDIPILENLYADLSRLGVKDLDARLLLHQACRIDHWEGGAGSKLSEGYIKH